MASPWIPRRGVKRSIGDGHVNFINIRVLGVYIDETRLNCTACKEVLPKEFITLQCYHSACVNCMQKCVKDGKFLCPLCRQTTQQTQTNHRDPILLEVLRNYPRVVPCGRTCTGCDVASEHINTCIECTKVKHADLQKEYDALKTQFAVITGKNESVEESNARIRDELQKYEKKYGNLPDEDTDSDIDSF